MRWLKTLAILLYFLAGLYLINLSIEYYILPDIISSFNSIVFLIAGFLLILGGLNFWRVSRHRKNMIFPQ